MKNYVGNSLQTRGAEAYTLQNGKGITTVNFKFINGKAEFEKGF